jgi:hypothetical protein
MGCRVEKHRSTRLPVCIVRASKGGWLRGQFRGVARGEIKQKADHRVMLVRLQVLLMAAQVQLQFVDSHGEARVLMGQREWEWCQQMGVE